MRGICPLALASVCAAFVARAEVRFNRDIRPIMAETCFRCHGPDKNARMAGMRLDIRDEALKPLADGAMPIVPGDPDKSAIIQRIFAPGARVMPPAVQPQGTDAAQKETIRQWVAEGREVRGPLGVSAGERVPRRPKARQRSHRRVSSRSGWNTKACSPRREADRRTLIRRVSFDLTGLPPTPAEDGGVRQRHRARRV